MNRSLKLSMLLALALGSSQAVALELGQIRVKSALGQPLVAEIPVTPEGPADLRNLSARLASDEDFLRAGITEGRTRVPLSFSIVNGPGGSKLIRITSTDAINDPYLDLLVQVDNAAGKSVREYTILLDPPGMAAAPPAPAPAAAPQARRPAPAPRAPVASSAPAAATPSAAAGSSVTVQNGQTLSAIAQQVKPAGADLNQTLLALKQSNPGAFYRDNINALKSGAVLRVPTADEARAMTVAAALEEVRRQNSDWRAGAVGTPTNVADSATRATASSSPTAPASKRDDHLELLPSGEGAKSAAAGAGKGSADVRRDLQRSQESLATLQQQGAELRSRLKDLEDINSKNERLLSLKDSEIAELQRKLAEARKAAPAGESAATPMVPAPAAAEKPSETPPAPAGSVAAKTAPAAASTAATGGAVAPAVASTSIASAPAAASQPAAAKPAAAKPAAVKPAAKPAPAAAEEPWYMQTWAWAAGAGAVVLLLLLMLRGRRNKSPAKASGSSLADRFGAVPALGDTDPDQDELLDQLAEHPDDISLHLELVSLYYHRRDVEHFEAAAEAMYAHISDPQQSEWQDVAAMGEDLVPGHPLFAGVDTSVPEAERAPLGGFNLDDYDTDATVAAPVPPPMPSGPSKISEYHFDFNLTPRQEAARQAEAEAELHDEPEHAFSPDATAHDAAVETPSQAEAGSDIPSWESGISGMDYEPTEFSDDPIDTKLDLARAYLDMGDADGARAMLEEVLSEGSQPQRDTARRLLDGIA
ncbi:fimbrial protein FimV [Dyella ginsengisoli]|jgi:pilus assembly protein FimV|uniref:Fimbrial protein FimV n=1 Tax=Dyella ginsengisoli TaxID=363848 RepID=A0ABW8JVM8_9GAMM